MNQRLAKKIVGGRAEGRTVATLNRAHGGWWRSVSRRLGIRGRIATTSPGLAVQGGSYFTLGGKYLYLLDVKLGRWLLPIFKTARQSRAVLAQVARLGGPVPDGWQFINDGDAFIESVTNEHKGLPVALPVNFTSAGDVLSHQTVNVGGPAPSLTTARAEQTLWQWRKEDPFTGGNPLAL